MCHAKARVIRSAIPRDIDNGQVRHQGTCLVRNLPAVGACAATNVGDQAPNLQLAGLKDRPRVPPGWGIIHRIAFVLQQHFDMKGD